MPRPSPKIVYAQPVEELPDEDDINEPRVEWIKKAEFRAAMAGAHIDKDGQLSMTVKIPVEDKYLALPITDVRSILMVFSVYEPVQATSADG